MIHLSFGPMEKTNVWICWIIITKETDHLSHQKRERLAFLATVSLEIITKRGLAHDVCRKNP